MSKTWYESPGYSTTVLGIICDFANMLDEKAGIDLFKQRPTAIVKTSAKGGYYIDVFRSMKMEGGDKMHDYFYHNLGQEMKVMDAATGKPLDMKPTEELAFAGGHLYAYSYIYIIRCRQR